MAIPSPKSSSEANRQAVASSAPPYDSRFEHPPIESGSSLAGQIRQSDASTVDLELDTVTAVNSPKALSPVISLANLGEPSRKGHTHCRGIEGIELEAELKHVADDGLVRHGAADGRGGVRERRAKVDRGKGLEDMIIIDWRPNDPDNPINWPARRKWSITLTALLLSTLTAMNVTSVAPMSHFAPEWFGVSRLAFQLSLTVMMVAISLTPMLLAPLSEVYGRNWIYQITSVLTAIFFIPQALSRSFAALLVVRWFQGMSSSVGNSMVGGTIADLFPAKKRGFVMNLFAMLIFVGQAGGGFIFGWVAMYWGVQWCYGVQGIAGAGSVALNLWLLRETRADVMLSRRARKLTSETGVLHICAGDLEKTSLAVLMRVSLVRPFQFLFTEPIVTFLSIWAGFSWACIFLGGASSQLVFAQYGFNPGQQGSIQLCLLIGAAIGFLLCAHQNHLYSKAAALRGGTAPPEVRLYYGAWGGLLFPLGLYVFAWVGRPDIPWQVPAAVLCISNVGIFLMYAAIYNYLADAYETYSSSAQAAQCFARNFLSAVFPLFAVQLYEGLGYPQASTLVASFALFFQIAPILIIFYGRQLRARSKVATSLGKLSGS